MPSDDALILLAHADKWIADSLETILTQGGFRIVTVTKRMQVLEQVRRQNPDCLILDLALDRRASDAFALCRSLRSDPRVSRALPIIIVTEGPVLRPHLLDALRAGAWELRGDPLDAEELVLRLQAYVQGKRETDRVAMAGLLDQSGLYNSAGLRRRAGELAAFTARKGLPLACAVFRPSEPAAAEIWGDRRADAFKSAGRVSAAIGRTGKAEFAVFAPATDAAGAERMVRRLTTRVARLARVTLASGVSTEMGELPGGADDLLTRARDAVQ
jgi:CheY-like chemotaxis protein